MPAFWHRAGNPALGALLTPLSWGYRAAGSLRRQFTSAWRAPVPVICVGNVTVGGTGKTPVVQALAEAATQRGLRPAIISRGYGGNLEGPVRVDPDRHTAKEVGDEPLLLARTCPVYIARDRAAAARRAMEDAPGLILMDDGLQNPSVEKTVRIVVIDSHFGFGNGRIMPAGPLREAPEPALALADAIVLMGDGGFMPPDTGNAAVIRARLEAEAPPVPPDTPLFAFAGIGFPEKFFGTLREAGMKAVDCRGFPDHHLYTETELNELQQQAKAQGLTLITTRKDWVRLPPDWRGRVHALDVRAAFDPADWVDGLLSLGFENGEQN